MIRKVEKHVHIINLDGPKANYFNEESATNTKQNTRMFVFNPTN